MAKLNIANNPHQTQEEFPLVTSFLGSLGVLVCLIVTLAGIKLWWFKHRLNFEQTSLQNGAAGGQTPNVVVTRREKKSKFTKDKRWSHQIYESVEIHGVFKQKNEDDIEIERPHKLPPVRIKHAESAPSLILPPPRHKRRQEQANSNTFSESSDIYETIKPLNNVTPGTASRPSSLVFQEPEHTKISLTFEEVEHQMKLQQEQQMALQSLADKKPQPPKRANRSNSSLPKVVAAVMEKPHRFLKSSQSIAVPEHRKAVERRATGFHMATEDDLTKIDDFEEPRFEQFGDRRPTGYIKYEEVDFHLSSMRRPNEESNVMYDSGYMDNQSNETAIEALRNEEIVYQKNNDKGLGGLAGKTGHSLSSLYVNQGQLNVEFNDLSPKTFDDPMQRRNVMEGKVGSFLSDTQFRDDVPENLDDDAVSMDRTDFKSKEVTSGSPTDMEPQALVFYDEDDTSNGQEKFGMERDYLVNHEISKHSKVPNYNALNTARHLNADGYEIPKDLKKENIADDANKFELFTSNLHEKLDDQENKKLEDQENANHEWKFCKIMPNRDLMAAKDNTKSRQTYVDLNYFNEDDVRTFNSNRNDTEEPLQLPDTHGSLQHDIGCQKEEDRGSSNHHSKLQNDPEEDTNNEDEFAHKQTVKFEFNKLKNNEEQSQPLKEDTHLDHIPSKPTKEDLYEEIRIKDVKPDQLYEEIQTPGIPQTREDTPKEVKTESAIPTIDEIDAPPIAVLRKTRSPHSDKDFNSSIWHELEQDLQLDFSHNIDEEFDKIRHSFEMNEADFLEIKDELQLNSPTVDTLPSISSIESTNSAFGKSIEDDWENFEKLKTQTKESHYEIAQGHKEIQITFDAETSHSAKGKHHVSILKESKLEQTLDDTNNKPETKPRKSKVTFDFNTEEHVIPARRSVSDEDTEDEEYYGNGYQWGEVHPPNFEDDDDEDVYNKPPPPIPTQRVTINKAPENLSPVLTIPSTISLFGSQISPDDTDTKEDSWSAIRKHRHLTSQFQNLSLDSPTSPPPPTYPPPPLPTTRTLNLFKDSAAPKPQFRNPMAQLAIQRAKEVRADMNGFKTRSIKDSKQAQTKKTSHEFVQLRDSFDDTDA